MSDLPFCKQDDFNGHHTVPLTFESSGVWPSNPALENFLIDPLLESTAAEFSSLASWTPSLENALYGNCAPDSAWALYPSPISHPNAFIWQQATHYQSFPSEAALAGVEKDLLPGLFQSATLLERCPTQTRSPSGRVSAPSSPARSAPPLSMRYTPYPNAVRRSVSPISVYECRWSSDGTSCGALVTGTKNTIGRHLQDVHAVSLKADKTDATCRWDACGRTMRRESIARHVVAVHLRNKVICPTCGSRFARTDSLQRHQRNQCLLLEEDASDAGKVGEQTDAVG